MMIIVFDIDVNTAKMLFPWKEVTAYNLPSYRMNTGKQIISKHIYKLCSQNPIASVKNMVL